MSIPDLVLSLVLSSLYGIVFYLIFGRGWLQLALYWLSALVGFAVGQAVSRLVGLNLLPIGSISVVEASIVSIVALLVARTVWQSRVKPAGTKK